MKNSNLMLAIMLGCAVTFIAAIPALYQVELSTSRFDANQKTYTRHAYPGAKVLKLINAHSVIVIPSHSLGLEYRPESKDSLTIHELGDTLTIEGDGHLLIGLPNLTCIAINAEIRVRGVLHIFDPPSMSFVVRDSRLYSLQISRDRNVAQNLEDLWIMSKGNSIVDLSSRFDIGTLHLHNLERFVCTNEVRMRDTDFVFEAGGKVQTLSCREGLSIYGE